MHLKEEILNKESFLDYFKIKIPCKIKKKQPGHKVETKSNLIGIKDRMKSAPENNLISKKIKLFHGKYSNNQKHKSGLVKSLLIEISF